MNWRKRCRKICFYSCLSSLAFVILLTIGYYTPRKWWKSVKTSCSWQICVENNGAHTNIIVPVDNDLFTWSDRLDLQKIDPIITHNYRYLSFGWGDRDFYLNTPTWADLDWKIAFKALFIPTASAMEVKGLAILPQGEEIKCVAVDRSDYLQLMEYINETFQTNSQGEKIRIANGHNRSSAFYAAVGNYTILKTCNDWTAIGLRKADLNTPLWSGLSGSIMKHLSSDCE